MTLSPKRHSGSRCRGFTCTKALPIEELQVILYEFLDEETGARVVHIEADDPENVFCLSFQTLPSDSTGVAHILEHTVLCGSKKFPVKDPFFCMRRRSLNTFMNAFTGADFTCYPAASQVEKDFYNLLEVYLDAVFYPELKQESFWQEGHRLEFDPELMYKGVVYNEMKGSLSNPESRLWQEISTHLMPDLTYAFNSGGDPKEIPELTWEGLKEFHEMYYHPSRCIFFFYGNLPIEKHLDFVTKHVLKGVKKQPLLPALPKQRRFAEGIVRDGSYPGPEGKGFISFAWLTTSAEEEEEALALSVIDSILMETDASPLKDALLKSGLCTQADSYFDTDMSEAPYLIVCRGCKKGDEEKLRAVLMKTLQNLKITTSQVEGALHQLEFSRLEISGDEGPFGLTLFMRAILSMQHGCPPELGLSTYTLFKKLRSRVKDPDYLPSMINKYLLKNPHFLTHTFFPDATLEKMEDGEEQARLKEVEKALSEEQKEAIRKRALDLEKYQEASEAQSIDCLPKIGLNDIPKEGVDFSLHHEQIDHLTVFHHECFTNHILYAQLLFDLPQVPYEDLPYLQLLLTLLPELGAGERNYRENLEYINAHLGDFGTSLGFYPQLDDPNQLRPAFGFKGKVLTRNIDKLFSLFEEGCRYPNLTDERRIKELILQVATFLENGLSRHAMGYATGRAVRIFSVTGYIKDALKGLGYFRFIHNLASDIDRKLPHVIGKLRELAHTLFHLTLPHLIVSGDANQYRILSKEKFFGLPQFPSKAFTPWDSYALPSSAPSEGFPISSPVTFSSLGMKTVSLSDPASPALTLSTDLMENTFLHKKVREQGGAYGSGAGYNSLAGTYHLYSYRDPHVGPTYAAFQEGIERVAAGHFNDQDLEEAKRGIFQDLDTPLPPGLRAGMAYTYFREGQTKQVRQAFRDRLLALTKQEIKEAVGTHLDPQSGVKATFGGEGLLKNEKNDLILTSL